ncbi:MAG TPA: hypothetical protein VND64_16810 [Pirellulales bacterium]|nr:hypothetical protein [Pirellulales bacterium]
MTSAYAISEMSSMVPSGRTPTAVQASHGFDQVTLENGAIAGDGSGQTSRARTTPDVSLAADANAGVADFKIASSFNAASVSPGSDLTTGLGRPVDNTLINDLVSQPSSPAPTPAAATQISATMSITTPSGSSALLARHTTPVDVALFVAAFTTANPQSQPVSPVPVAAPTISSAAGAAAPTTTPAPSIVGSSIVDLDLISLGLSELAEDEDQGPRTLPAPGTDDKESDDDGGDYDGDYDAIDDQSPAGRSQGNGASTVAPDYRAGATREALHDTCFADAPWSAKPILDELAAFGLGDLSKEFPSPALLTAVILTSFEGYHRSRTDSAAEDKRRGENPCRTAGLGQLLGPRAPRSA